MVHIIDRIMRKADKIKGMFGFFTSIALAPRGQDFSYQALPGEPFRLPYASKGT